MEAPATRDLFGHRYYRTNKMLLKWVGLWPYQTIRVRSTIYAIVFLIGISQMAAQTIAMLKGLDDWEFVMQCIVSLIFDTFVLTKMFTSLFNLQKMLELLNRMCTNWYVRARDRGANVFHEYAENGRKMTIAYTDFPILRTVMCYTTWIIFAAEPAVPKVIDILLRNGTEPGEFGTSVDYLVIDLQKYYFYIILHTAVSAFLGFSVTVGCDSMFIVFIQHGCGLYAALGNVLTAICRRDSERIGKNKGSSETSETTHALDERNMHYEHIATCIEQHNEAINYSELIEATYSWCFFFIVGFNVFMISLTGLEIVKRTTNPQQTAKFAVGNMFCMVHLYIESYMAQILMDHSITIRSYILNIEWYRLPLKTQKILLFMVMRCNVPSQITAGKIWVMSIQSFGTFLKTSLSYFTLLHSI